MEIIKISGTAIPIRTDKITARRIECTLNTLPELIQSQSVSPEELAKTKEYFRGVAYGSVSILQCLWIIEPQTALVMEHTMQNLLSEYPPKRGD